MLIFLNPQIHWNQFTIFYMAYSAILVFYLIYVNLLLNWLDPFFYTLTGTVDAILTLPFEMLSSENIAADIFQGCFVVCCTLFAFAGLVWLREQILHGGGKCVTLFDRKGWYDKFVV